MQTIMTSSTRTEHFVEVIETARHTDLSTLVSEIRQFLISAIPNMLAAVAVLVVGYFFVRLLMSGLRRLVNNNGKIDPTVIPFLLSAVRIGLYILLAVIVITTLIPSALGGMVAALGVFGLAVSLAVQDSLANLAGGVTVLFTKPFSLGDYVQLDGNEGNVQEIRLTHTILKTVDNKLIHVPNGDVAKGRIVNFTTQTQRRLDLEFSISYSNDFRQAQQIIKRCVSAHPHAKQDPEPVIRLLRHGESALVLCCRVWVDTGEYWGLYFDLLEQVKEAFDEAGITIPFNQLEVRLLGQ